MIEIKNVSKKYGNLVVLDDINISIKERAVTALIGPNGAGKSTLLGVLSKLLTPDQGEVYLDEVNINKIKPNQFAKAIAILKQTNQIQVNLTVRELVSFGRWPHSKGNLTKEDELKIDEAIKFLRLKEVENKNINQLSGGQKQRAYIAMIVAQDTKYVLLDEPLNNLDMRYSVDMMLILQDLVQKLGKTVMIVLHDINFAATFSDHIIAMKDGKIIKEGTPDEIMDKGVLDYVFDHEFCIAGVNGKKYCIYYQGEPEEAI
ncbi:iron complex transport system ATP-binding protein [Acholeplasma morum]|uniref:iron ABC transporter ATP-binding protein n=1 Tax=Paracholeplasma morum TaxID=264637 RepID=UPI0019598870|nr:ATP-binding cassette domain-containing protein [Paracholeplasma morum]MBM7452766.1 iron complex transport system ATP-binding protein [Paracholeplasma morum]